MNFFTPFSDCPTGASIPEREVKHSRFRGTAGRRGSEYRSDCGGD